VRVAYGATRESAARFGLPCGGRLEVVVERVRDSASWKALAAALRARQARVRCVHLEDGAVEFTDDGPDFRCDEHLLVRRFGPRWRLLLVGAGDLARQVAHCAAHLDYDLVVCEPRAEVRAAWDLPEATLDARMPDEVATEADERTALITLTHDPRIDDLALMQALIGRAFYVGAVGSQATSARRRERLLTLGLPPQAVADLHAPVGLPIGSRTPAEIAISILAEVTAVRRRLEQRASIGVECVS
jgi:xanthine dehydrogenase accessory factor